MPHYPCDTDKKKSVVDDSQSVRDVPPDSLLVNSPVCFFAELEREATIWEMEEKNLYERHQLMKQQMKDQYFLQRHQLLKKHEKVRSLASPLPVAQKRRVH